LGGFANDWQNTTDANNLAGFAGRRLRSNAHCADVVPETGEDGFVDMLDLAFLADNWLVGFDNSLFSIDY